MIKNIMALALSLFGFSAMAEVGIDKIANLSYEQYEVFSDEGPVIVSVDYSKINACWLTYKYSVTNLPDDTKIVTKIPVRHPAIPCTPQRRRELETGIQFKFTKRASGYAGGYLIVPAGSKVEIKKANSR